MNASHAQILPGSSDTEVHVHNLMDELAAKALVHVRSRLLKGKASVNIYFFFGLND